MKLIEGPKLFRENFLALVMLLVFTGAAGAAFAASTNGDVAQPPSGHFRYEFSTNSVLPLWNFTGSYSPGFYVTTNDTLELHHDAWGKITGTSQIWVDFNVEQIGAVAGLVRS